MTALTRYSTTLAGIAAVVILLWSVPLSAQVPGPSGPKSDWDPTFSAKVDAIFEDLDRGRQPGCVVAVEGPDQTFHRRGYGMADLEHAVPLTPRSIFHLGELFDEELRTMELLLESEAPGSSFNPSLSEVTHTRFFDSLGMRATRFLWDETQPVTDRARGYLPPDAGAGFRYAAHPTPLSPPVAVTSVADLGNWLGTLLTEDPRSSHQSVGGLVTLHVADHWQGIRRADRAGHRLATLFLPHERLGIVVACNRTDLDPLQKAEKVLEAVRTFPI